MPDNDKDIKDLKILTKKHEDILSGGIKSNNLKNYRNTYIINAIDNLDDTYPLYLHFNIASDMTKIVSIQLSFWIIPYRYYDAGGVTEEDNSPTIGVQLSKVNEETYGSILGNYTVNVSNLELKSYFTTAGVYIVKFTSSARARLSVQLTAKLDITAR